MQPGFCIIHANQLETLAELAISHCANMPLAPLENEVCLVQSNGMADWLKLKQAEATGISASMDFPMPASFLWRMYQQVLHPDLIHAASPFAKDSLQWRLLKLIPTLLEASEFARPRRFLTDDTYGTRTFQLARKVADLFDQYQLYRADWIRAWEAGHSLGLGPHEQWQAALWRVVIDSLPAAEQHRSRAHMHQAFLDALDTDATPRGLPRRILLFGISSLPRQLLEALYALSRHSQLLLMVLSPCREYWGDRGRPVLDDHFAATNPLLDSWGGQGRDFLNLLQSFEADEVQLQYTQQIDPYADAAEHTRPDSIICALQQAMLDNALPEPNQPLPPAPGLGFYPAYSPQREVEVLHDQLLSLFAHDDCMQYQDVVVMTPNIDQYAPHIEAVFNRYPTDDPRHLVFSISDRRDSDTPLYNAIEYLLDLPRQRLTLSEILSLLQVSAIQRASGIDEDDLEQLRAWTEAAHIRWALGSTHKQQLLELTPDDANVWRSHNTWQAGLDQLLAGYCAGDADIFSGIAVDEVSANQGPLLGLLSEFIERLGRFSQRLGGSKTPSEWDTAFTALLDTFFAPTEDADRLLSDRLAEARDNWLADCELAGFDRPLPLTQARQGWLDRLTQAGMRQQLKFNGITFCTLMPMRALPFKHLFLLGMDERNYPRQQPLFDFDLMQHHYRPGDRNRRDDDHYLFLEALMSARDSLSISWVGRDIRKNEPRPPSTLVAQLRDLVDRCWVTNERDVDGQPMSASTMLTRQSPLAAFSRHYFRPLDHAPDNYWPRKHPARTYAREWYELYQEKTPSSAPPGDAHLDDLQALSPRQLATVLKSPMEVFYRNRLKIYFEKPAEDREDDEPFALDGLQCWQLRNDLLESLLHDEPLATRRWKTGGALPPGAFAEQIYNRELHAAESIRRRRGDNLDEAEKAEAVTFALTLSANGLTSELTVNLTQTWRNAGQLIFTDATASNLYRQGQYRYDKLAPFWVNHLAASAAGLNAVSVIVSRDKQIRFQPLSSDAAQTQLNRLFFLYQLAWRTPLPLDPRAIKLPDDPEEPVFDCGEKALRTTICDRWWDEGMDDDTTAFFAEVLYRPIKQAIDGVPQ